MHFTIFTPILTAAFLTATAMVVAELDREGNGTIIPLTKRPSLWKQAVNLNALYSHVESIDTKILRGFQNYEKNTGNPHPLSMERIESEHPKSKRNGGVGAILTNSNKLIWYTTAWIGTPARRFTVAIDTGSSDLFVPGPICSYCEGRTKWDPELSQTSVDKNMEFELTFANGATVSGKQYIDNVTITGLTADRQTFGGATTWSPIIKVKSIPSDGMLGMGFQSISGFSDSPLFETLVNEGKVGQPIFSIKLTSSGGELYLGGSNTDLFVGEITYTDVINPGFWLVAIESIQGNHEVLLTDLPAILDTGSNFIIGDPSGVSILHTRLGGKFFAKGFYSFPCNKFPVISFTFEGTGGRTFQIPESLLNLGPVEDGSSDCFSSIISGNNGRRHWTIGGTFLMSVYTIFDFGNERVGFADLAT